MRSGGSRALAWLPLMGALAPVVATDVVYVTDLDIYTLLAPCAQSALSYNVMTMTYENCPEAVTALQSCVCSKGNLFATVSASISSDVSYSCGSTASSDQQSASLVFSHYCDQGGTATFATPATPVSQYITDIPEMSYLAPCASSQISYAVMEMTYSLCPPDAVNLATCVCQKNQNSLVVSQTINTMVGYDCSSHTADIQSAQAFFAAYCNLNSGTSSFPTASNPPGDMSYYITDIPQFNSLARCAKDGLSSAVFTNTYDLCPTGPQLLASCACLKPSMSSMVSSYISSNIQYECSQGGSEDISSALAIFNMYCSAANNKLVVTGITTSVAQSAPFGLGGSGGGATGTGTGTGNKATATHGTTKATGTGASGGSGGSGSSGDSSGDGNGQPNGTEHKSNAGVIAGAVVGVVAGLGLLAAAAFFVWRHARNNSNRPTGSNEFQQLNNLGHGTNNQSISTNHGGPGGPGGPGELGGTAVGDGAAMLSAENAYGPYGAKPPLPSPSPSLSVSKYNNATAASTISPQSPPPNSTSPASAHVQGAANYGYPNGVPPHASPQAELPGQQTYSPNAPSYAELQGGQQSAELYGGQVYNGQAYGAPPQGQPIYQADSTPVESPHGATPSPGSMTYHSGPVPTSYSELDSGSSPHAR
ncbi:uncharacterized protein SPSK_08685 [Sporothrix schenckii 1099-18]|uniref:Extracellular membrane protein CFEM domain-containing protein n=1 Tax=Sporothrix schenckii 1099-18 TaxID=1397361 RepID=A0A0F2MAU3_SPOSC|nr:uncharacterized protein SPSK_08685 [Sporothrix schenckii 1099-18]KJR85286.1 hypothetical protein SPSK_08685 [Sporothrix schenckii 1099-18]